MTLFQDVGTDPRDQAARLSDLLVAYGAIGSLACGERADLGRRVATIAASFAAFLEFDAALRAAIYYAAVLRSAGGLDNPALRKGADLSERYARLLRGDIPAEGARACARIAALPPLCADLVRWQAEAWDGTGNPDRLRWDGIPIGAQVVHAAAVYAMASDPDDGIAQIAAQSGRVLAPELVRSFTMWFHTTGGEPLVEEPPIERLDSSATSVQSLLDFIAAHLDEHDGVPGRCARIAAIADKLAVRMKLAESDRVALAIAARLYAAGGVAEHIPENERFDPLVRLAIGPRAENARRAAALFADIPSLRSAAGVVGARAEWYDGTGKPAGAAHQAIPLSARILAVAIACEELGYHLALQLRERRTTPLRRLADAAGTQFDPEVVRVATACLESGS
ncbi:MAG: HD domain-containing phosphohydrolase [Vulcanimicrobiaceae bacterium]